MEKLSASQLADRIKANAPKNTERFYDRGIRGLLDEAKLVVTNLRQQQFEETEEGYVEIRPVDTSDRDYGAAIYGQMDVWFVDSVGYATRLGGIHGSSAEVNISPDEVEPLYSNDERWDTVVGAIGRAVLSISQET